MKKLKKPTVGILMATIVFSNMQLALIYGNEADEIGENVNKQIIQNENINTKYQNKSSKENDVINIPDINLKKYINSSLGKDENSDITRVELESLEYIDGAERNIKNLEGIQYCVNLKEVDLSYNNISDISALSGLINLEWLSLNNNNISDISALSELTNMWMLNLNGNNISDISALSELTNMWSLNLGDNNISDIGALSGLINLEWLALNDNNISDISALSGLIDLSGLVLDNNNISDISALSGLIKICDLTLSNNNISNITPLLNIKGGDDGSYYFIDLSANPLDLNDSKTMEVIQHLESISDELYYGNQYLTEFNDIKGHWAEETINSFTKQGYINGYEDNTFKPDNSMTRAEFVKVVNRVFGYTQKGEEQFTDVNENDWFYDDICIGIKEGYINGKSKDIFAPNENITREEVATILTNIMNNKDENLDKLSTFKDGDKTSQWAQSSVEGAIEAGYLNGDDKGLLNPISNITRAEAITMLSRVKK